MFGSFKYIIVITDGLYLLITACPHSKKRYQTEPYRVWAIRRNPEKGFAHDAKLKNSFVHNTEPEKGSEK